MAGAVLRRDESYERGARLTFVVVKMWLEDPRLKLPRFRFPPRDIALIGDLRDIGQRLAVNDGARELLAHLIKRSIERTGNAPTAMMLRGVLEELGHPIEVVSLSELGIDVGTA